jgi:hypothetical protein
VVESRKALFRTFGQQDQVVGMRFEIDVNGDGVVDAWSSSVGTLDHQGNVIEDVYNLNYAGRSDGDADGTPEYTTVTRSTHDAPGNVKHRETDVYDTGSGDVPDWRYEDSYEYDAAGRLTRQESGVDLDLDGVNEDVTILTIAYDERARLVVWTMESEGDATSGERERYVVDAQGYLTSIIREHFDGTEWIWKQRAGDACSPYLSDRNQVSGLVTRSKERREASVGVTTARARMSVRTARR